MRLIGAERLLD